MEKKIEMINAYFIKKSRGGNKRERERDRETKRDRDTQREHASV